MKLFEVELLCERRGVGLGLVAPAVGKALVVGVSELERFYEVEFVVGRRYWLVGHDYPGKDRVKLRFLPGYYYSFVFGGEGVELGSLAAFFLHGVRVSHYSWEMWLELWYEVWGGQRCGVTS